MMTAVSFKISHRTPHRAPSLVQVFAFAILAVSLSSCAPASKDRLSSRPASATPRNSATPPKDNDDNGVPLVGFAHTFVKNADQCFSVPVTYWMAGGDPVLFYLYYDSMNITDEGVADLIALKEEPINLAGLSEKNSHWGHNFAWSISLMKIEGSSYARLRFDNGYAFFKRIGAEGDTERYETVNPDLPFALTGRGKIVPMTPSDRIPPFDLPPERYELRDSDGVRRIFDRILWIGQHQFPEYLLRQIKYPDGMTLTIRWSAEKRPRVLSVLDSNGKGLKFNYEDRLLESVQDDKGWIHAFQYALVPDENGALRKKLASVKILRPIDGRPQPCVWSFSYRDPSNPGRAYGGAYAGDLVIRKRDPLDSDVTYDYQAARLVGKPPHARRFSKEDFNGRIKDIVVKERASGGMKVTKYHLRRLSKDVSELTCEKDGTVRVQRYVNGQLTGESVHPAGERN